MRVESVSLPVSLLLGLVAVLVPIFVSAQAISQPPSVTLAANGQSTLSVTIGDSYTLDWSSSNAQSCTIFAYGSDGAQIASFSITPNASGAGAASLIGSYTIQCTGTDGASVSKSVTVAGVRAPSAAITSAAASTAADGLTSAQIAQIKADLATIKSLGFNSIRFLTFTNPNDPAYASWAQNVFLSFPTPTAHELENLKEFFQLVDGAGLSYEVVLLMPDSHGLYYQNGVTGDDYKKFIDALWPVLWTGKLHHLYVGGDLSLDAPAIDTQYPDVVPNGQNFIANHRRWIEEIWPYVNAKCQGNCKLGIELYPAYLTLWDEGAASARWVRANLSPQPEYLGFQLYPKHNYLQDLGFEKSGVVDWLATTQDWLSGVVAASGPIQITADEFGLDLASEFTAQDQQDFLTQALPYFNTQRIPYNVWEFADHPGIGLFGLMTQDRTLRPAADAAEPSVAAARDAGLYPGIQYIPPESVGLQFIMPAAATVSGKTALPTATLSAYDSSTQTAVYDNTATLSVSAGDWVGYDATNSNCSSVATTLTDNGTAGTWSSGFTSCSILHVAPVQVGSALAGHTYVLTYTVTGTNGQTASASVTVRVKSNVF